MKLYSVSISGKKYYFLGKIPSSIIGFIDDYCDNYLNNSTRDPEIAFSELYKYVCYDLQCNINPVDIEHVFRINL